MFAGRGVGRKQFSLAMSSIKTPDDVVDLFKSLVRLILVLCFHSLLIQ